MLAVMDLFESDTKKKSNQNNESMYFAIIIASSDRIYGLEGVQDSQQHRKDSFQIYLYCRNGLTVTKCQIEDT